jgi:hypothetical protein
MSAHQQVKVLLPWFVNGSLNEAEQSFVDEHLQTCDQCRQDVEQLVLISAEFNLPTESARWQDVARRAAANFVAGLDAAESRPSTSRTKARSRPLAWVTAAVACTFFLAVLLLLPAGDVYRTLGGLGGTHTEATVIQVVFSPDATEQSIRTLLLDDGNEVLSGPTRQGVYRVSLGEALNGDVYVARLKHHPDVIFVQKEMTP